MKILVIWGGRYFLLLGEWVNCQPTALTTKHQPNQMTSIPMILWDNDTLFLLTGRWGYHWREGISELQVGVWQLQQGFGFS